MKPGSDQFDINRAGALLALLNLKSNTLAFVKRLPARSHDGAEMDEYVAAFIIFDETKPLLIIKPFNSPLCQSRALLFFYFVIPIDTETKKNHPGFLILTKSRQWFLI